MQKTSAQHRQTPKVSITVCRKARDLFWGPTQKDNWGMTKHTKPDAGGGGGGRLVPSTFMQLKALGPFVSLYQATFYKASRSEAQQAPGKVLFVLECRPFCWLSQEGKPKRETVTGPPPFYLLRELRHLLSPLAYALAVSLL